MDSLRLFKILLQHDALSFKRSYQHKHNKVAGIVYAVMVSCFILYLFSLALMLAFGVRPFPFKQHIAFFFASIPIVLIVDFFIRLIYQSTPAQFIQSYLLLPLRRKLLINTFLAKTCILGTNFVWLAYAIPYCFIAISPFQHPWVFFLCLSSFLFLIQANGQLYILCRTLIYKSPIYIFIPIALYLSIVAFFTLPLIFSSSPVYSILDSVYSNITNGNPLSLVIIILLFGISLATNRQVQLKSMRYIETNKTNNTNQTYKTAERIGKIRNIGIFLQLELLQIIRNKSIRIRYIIIIPFIFIINATQMLDTTGEEFKNQFWMIYTFLLPAYISITTVMQAEGNYIGLLMVQPHKLFHLLQAKYFFNLCLLIIPIVSLLPAIYMGTVDLFFVLALSLFCGGCQYFIMFQLAVYNNLTIAFNAPLMKKSNMSTNPAQLIFSTAAMLLPTILIAFLKILTSPAYMYLTIGVLGLIFILTEKIWMKHIFLRMMKRKHINLRGFYSTLQS